MELNIPESLIYEIKQTVASEHTAKAYGSGLAEVYATPAMIALMENAAYKSIEEFLPEGYSSVGMEINMQHLKATLPGKEVKAISKVTDVDGRKVTFEIKVFENEELAGSATHRRFVINSQRFMEKLDS